MPFQANIGIIFCFVCVLLTTSAVANDSPQFRGPDRDGHFQAEGLLKQWPEGGPTMLWSSDGLGESYASITVVGDRLYTTGKTDLTGWVFALDRDGQPLWKREFGRSHAGNGYPGTRSTPTYDDGMLYIMSSLGKAVCLRAADGSVVWSVELWERFGGDLGESKLNLYFGAAESPLIVDDLVIYTPGAPGATMVALDKKTGETRWQTSGLDDKSAYCNPRLFEHQGKRQIVTMVAAHMIGVDPQDGQLQWSFDYEAEYGIHAVSPVFADNHIYVSDGYGQGGTMVTLAADGKQVSKSWHREELDVHHGGLVLMDGRIYGAASNKDWYVLDLKTGDILAEMNRIGKGALVTADGLLYGYVESGDVILADPDPANFRVISQFKITAGSGKHWSHPVIADGVLYIRHGETLMAFDIARR